MDSAHQIVAIKLKIPKIKSGGKSGKSLLPRDPIVRAELGVFVILSALVGGFFSYYYVTYDHIIDKRFRGAVFSNSAKIYAIPKTVRVTEKIDAHEIAAELRRAGYSEKDGQSPLGSYRLVGHGIEIDPGPESYHSPEPATITIRGGKVDSITSKPGGDLAAYELEPQLVTALFDAEQRSKRQIVKYQDIPKVMVDAVLAIEDRRFFQHSCMNYVRLAEAAWVDFTHQRHEQGGSTITMQISRAFFLTPEKTLKRKLVEMLIAIELEQKFTKQQIFEFYANRVDLGQRGSFTIGGFAEAARAYFNKDLKDITLPEAALLAGLIQAPSYLSPYRHPERALERRNTVLDEQVTKMRTKRVKVGKGKYETKVKPGPDAQVALIAMDPHTGQVLALVGGRNYGFSQLNHAAAKRPTGSIFKPFVYAAALNTALDGTSTVLTPASTVPDQPSTFSYGDQIYEPRNYKEEYHGDVTLRYALALSLNNATVKLAEEVGYDKVAEIAKAAGIISVKPTPAMALGAYDATPLDLAGAYTVFANGGVRVPPILIDSVRDSKGDVVMDFNPEKRTVLDPRIAFVITNMLEGVLNFGTAYPVRTRGFNAPAAGKTGSSHDGWFAGYTSNLLCVVWVGYDDYSDLRLSGAQTAAPIWAEFMKKAITLPQYSDVKPFSEPAGVVDVQLDKITNRLATPSCPDSYTAAFIAGTEPHDTCDQGGGVVGFFSRIFGTGSDKVLPPSQPGSQAAVAGAQTTQDPAKKKKGFFGKFVGIFKDDKTSPPPSKPPNSGENNPR